MSATSACGPRFFQGWGEGSPGIVGLNAEEVRAFVFDIVSALGRVFHYSYSDYMSMTIPEILEIAKRVKNG